MPSLAGPKRPQDRIDLDQVKATFTTLFTKPVAENGFDKPAAELGKRFTIKLHEGSRNICVPIVRWRIASRRQDTQH